MGQLFSQLAVYFKSSKPHHVTTGFLFLILLGLNAHLYAQQEKVEGAQGTKADKETIAEMLAQNKELIDIQRQAQLAQHAQWQESLMQLSALESRVLNTDSQLQSQIFELKSDQRTVSELLKQNQDTNKQILEKLGALDSKVSRLPIE